ncbi:Chemotaxis protein methyltransferase CheR [Caenispirillum salinarum AK4]|uniref:Chemotaxis protein methyltransferase CheR n=1 Tax=Caenispirillum salinarum AK4 TaxID=1238182 RepID=K9GSF2_9PROT|nr:Chemotaxis protein methyltransferase CheR [Caenispirillum salinarum AK4]
MRQFFNQLPADLGFAYVVIVHLAPDRPSQLAEILGACTTMPVQQVEDSPHLTPNCIYVIPPDKELVIDGDDVSARPFSEPRGHRAPIDMFFRSVAAGRGDGMAVVLSGAGSDGAVGVRAIKEGGGVVFVQDPAEAEYAMMPRSALSSGTADFVGPVDRLVERFVEVTRSKRAVGALDVDESERELRRIVHFLRARTGHDFSSYKRATVMRRVTRRMQVTRRTNLHDYAGYLSTNPEEAQELFSDLLISVTTFFRDPSAYEVLVEDAIKPIFDDADPEAGLRVWVAGCATGEEAYSVAILLLEEAERRRVTLPIQIFATDLDEGALGTAREARYPEAIQADVSEERLRRFFVREGRHYRVKKDVRDTVLFATHSVLKDPPFMRLDLITCRNLLIYMERELQRQVCTLFHYGLKPHGFLFVGSAETVEATPDIFFTVSRDARLYRARPQASRNLPKLNQMPAEHRPHVPAPSREPEREERERGLGATHIHALEGGAPPSVLVDHEHRILHLSPNAGRYLLPSAGPFTADLAGLVRPELRLDLRTALRRAFDHGDHSLTLPVPVAFNGTRRRVLMQVTPVRTDDDGPASQALVFFLEGGAVEEVELAAGSGGADETQRLREELRAAEERLKNSRVEHENTIQDLRVANEELQSINEEYRSTSEELETSKEELQSMNEELQTVNSELKSKLESVSTSHSDLQNLVAATDIGTLFLDPELRIRMFTPRIADLFNITEADIGRTITDFTHRLTYDGITTDATAVLRDLAPLEQEVATAEGGWLMMRLRPYRTIDDRIDGIVVTFIDVTERREAVARMQESEERFRALVQATSDVVYRMGPDWTEMWELQGRGFLEDTGAPDRNWPDKYILLEDQAAVWERIKRSVRDKVPFELEHRVRQADGSVGWTQSRAVPLLDDEGEIREWFGAASDVTERRRSEEELREARDLLTMATNASHVGWGAWDLRTGKVTWDARGQEIIGLGSGMADRDWLDRVLPDDRPEIDAHLTESMREGRHFDVEFRVTHPDGKVCHVHATGIFERDAQGQPLRGTALVRDITELRNWQEAQRLLIGELNHRVKNMLTVVQSVAYQTQRSSGTMDDFCAAFEKRLQALAAAHALLTRGNWTGASLRTLVHDMLQGFSLDGSDSVAVEGPDVTLSPNATISFTMALHELVTNALKYGALSVPEGNVALTWRVDSDNGGKRLCLSWAEHGGPAVTPPTRNGFGTRMLKQGVAHELNGVVSLDYRPDGLVCSMEMPMDGSIRNGR